MVTKTEKPYVVGMDIGGTNTVFGIVDQRGNVLAKALGRHGVTEVDDDMSEKDFAKERRKVLREAKNHRKLKNN